MKKTLLTPISLAIAGVLAAGSANAVTVYETDDAYIKLTGEVAFELTRDVDDGDEIDSKTDNVDLEVSAGYKLENGVELFGYYAFEFASLTEEESDSKDFLKDHYIGAKKDGWLVKYGDMDYAVDDFAVRQNLDAKTATEMVLNPDDSERGGSKEVIYASFKGDGYFVSMSHDLALDADSDNNDDGDEETGYDIFAEAELLSDFWAGATYSVQDYYDDGKYASYGVQVEYKGIENLYLGASYVFGENYLAKEKGDSVNNEATGWDIAAKYKLNSKVSVGAGVGIASPDSGNENYSEDVTTWYVNANYNIRKNLDVYAEVYDEDSDQLGLLAGVSLDF
ncbi:porin [Vibrio sp. JC009]|uniref:porin n=1 Tax=Vibrio sp. JC009 TaxID=2912314 RepID=UPI0023B1936A|nr:porin [Vibrio sp. JC009]WED21011.1 porin [Vibrio sp. JC009]